MKLKHQRKEQKSICDICGTKTKSGHKVQIMWTIKAYKRHGKKTITEFKNQGFTHVQSGKRQEKRFKFFERIHLYN